MSELGFNVPSTHRSYGDGISIYLEVPSERPDKQEVKPAAPGLELLRLIH